MAAQDISFTRDYWTGTSRDGRLENGDGYYYYRMAAGGMIIEAYEIYENDDGTEVVSPLPEMQNVNWFDDLGFSDTEALDDISESEFERIKVLLTMQ